MRLVVHDFSGHPFQVHLSRELAKRGHEVFHLYCKDILGAKGNLTKGPNDSGKLTIEGLSIGYDINRYNFVKRLVDERRYGQVLSDRVAEINPDIVISSNTPLDSQFFLFATCKKNNIKFVFWLQDILGLATSKVLSQKYGWLGSCIGYYYSLRERSMLRQSDHVVPISEDFIDHLVLGNISRSRISVVNNWAPLDEMPLRPKVNSWSRAQELTDCKVALYSGALGLKHNPRLLWDLAVRFEELGADYKVVVISEGHGATWLREQQCSTPLESLILLPFQPFERLPEVLSSSDILLAILEPDAGEFCVPSKVLSYLCVGRPVVLAADARNLACRILTENDCGVVSDPKNSRAFSEATEALLRDDGRKRKMGENARSYAEKHFTLTDIGDKFETIITDLA